MFRGRRDSVKGKGKWQRVHAATNDLLCPFVSCQEGRARLREAAQETNRTQRDGDREGRSGGRLEYANKGAPSHFFWTKISKCRRLIFGDSAFRQSPLARLLFRNLAGALAVFRASSQIFELATGSGVEADQQTNPDESRVLTLLGSLAQRSFCESCFNAFYAQETAVL